MYILYMYNYMQRHTHLHIVCTQYGGHYAYSPTPAILKTLKPPILVCLRPKWPMGFNDLARLFSLQIHHPFGPEVHHEP